MDKVGRFAYKLDIFGDWRIHPVFSVTQLERILSSALGLFSRPIPSELPPIFIEGDTDTLKSFEVEKLLNK